MLTIEGECGKIRAMEITPTTPVASSSTGRGKRDLHSEVTSAMGGALFGVMLSGGNMVGAIFGAVIGALVGGVAAYHAGKHRP